VGTQCFCLEQDAGADALDSRLRGNDEPALEIYAPGSYLLIARRCRRASIPRQRKEATMLHSSFRPAADVFGELNRLQNVLDQVFRPLERSSIRALAGSAFPVINVGATPESLEILALAPGLDPATLQVTADRGLLVIAGERKAQLPERRDGTSVYAQERFSGNFRRVVTLPEDADPARIEARYRDGVLRISVAKRESSRPRRIDVN
jgi:HSP20 family protein